jgi:hypothetical protein
MFRDATRGHLMNAPRQIDYVDKVKTTPFTPVISDEDHYELPR